METLIDSTGHMLDIIDQLNKSGVIKEAFTRDHEPMDIDQETTECNGSDLGCVDKEKEKENPDKMKEDTHREIPEEVKQYMMNRVNKLREAKIAGSNIPDLKERLIAVGLLDKIEGEDPIRLPGNSTLKRASPVDPQEPGFVIVGSDVEKLYPSLKPLEGARLARIAIIQSDINIEDVDLTKALRYIYIVGGPELINRAGLNRISPKWMGKRADLLSVTGKNLMGMNCGETLIKKYIGGRLRKLWQRWWRLVLSSRWGHICIVSMV